MEAYRNENLIFNLIYLFLLILPVLRVDVVNEVSFSGAYRLLRLFCLFVNEVEMRFLTLDTLQGTSNNTKTLLRPLRILCGYATGLVYPYAPIPKKSIFFNIRYIQ